MNVYTKNTVLVRRATSFPRTAMDGITARTMPMGLPCFGRASNKV